MVHNRWVRGAPARPGVAARLAVPRDRSIQYTRRRCRMIGIQRAGIEERDRLCRRVAGERDRTRNTPGRPIGARRGRHLRPSGIIPHKNTDRGRLRRSSLAQLRTASIGGEIRRGQRLWVAGRQPRIRCVVDFHGKHGLVRAGDAHRRLPSRIRTGAIARSHRGDCYRSRVHRGIRPRVGIPRGHDICRARRASDRLGTRVTSCGP